jgi:Bacterial membrane protein YfhO
MLAVVAAVVVAQVPYLLGVFDPNPLAPRSLLVRSAEPQLLRGSNAADPTDGYIAQALGHRAALDLLRGHLPWWNPYEGTGAPLAGEMQSAALFPPTLLTAISDGQLYEQILLEIVAGLSTFLLLRRISINRWASAAGAIAFALSATFAWFYATNVHPVAFLPLLLLGIELSYAASVTGAPGGWWLIAVAGALSFYAGFPEVAYIDGLLAVFWFAWRCSCISRNGLTLLLRKGAAGVVVGVLLSAPLLVASTGYFTHADLAGHGGTNPVAFHVPVQLLPQFILPYVYGPIRSFNYSGGWDGYVSTSLLLFALIGLFSKGRRGLRLALLAWMALTFARIYGQPPLLGDALGLLPGMSRVAFSRYAFPSLEMAIIILAALGLDAVAKCVLTRQRVLWIGLASLVIVTLAAFEATRFSQEIKTGLRIHSYWGVSVVCGAAIVLVGVALALVRNSRVRTALVALVMVVDVLVLFAIPEASAPRDVTVDLTPVTYLQRHLGNSRFFTFGELQPNYGSYFGVRSLNVNDIPIPEAFSRYVHAHLDKVVQPHVFVGNYGGGRPPSAPSPWDEFRRNLAGYRAAAVAYVLAPPGQPLPNSALKLAFRSPTTWIYRLAGAAPYYTAANPRCKVRAEGTESVTLSCPAPTVLVRRETDLPGWSVRVDGHPTRIHRSDDLFQAVNVEQGKHRVRFSYSPPHIGWGFVGFALGCVWLILAPIVARRRRTPVAP